MKNLNSEEKNKHEKREEKKMPKENSGNLESREKIEKKNSTKRKVLSFEEFYQRFIMLSFIHQFIVSQIIRAMKKNYSDKIVHLEAFKLIAQKRAEKGITFTKLYNALNKKLYGTVSMNTYTSFLRRRSIHSDLFPATCEILGIKEDDYDNIALRSNLQGLNWLYNSLYDEDKIAMTELVRWLLVSETNSDYLEWELSQ